MKSTKLLLCSFVITISALITGCASAANYHIGSGQAYSSIADFPYWTSLIPGDHVYIHPGTYKEMIFLCQSGTEASPIVIEGVPDEHGNLPVLDGNSMVIPSYLDPHFSHYDMGGGVLAQGYGMIFINRSLRDDPYGTSWPEYITVRNLEIKSTTPENYTFTNTTGAVQAYPNGNAGVYVRVGSHLLFENLRIHDTGNGFEVQGVESMVRDVTIRGCHIYGTGRTDGRFNLEHGLYTEVSGLTFEYNIIGHLRSGAGGSAFKSRGANTVIRYNLIYSGARTLDLVEPENQERNMSCDGTGDPAGSMFAEPGFRDTWVYGNVFVNEYGSAPYSGRMFHYGADNCPANSRAGTLHFFNNTTVIDIDRAQSYYIRAFQPTSNRETIELYNNVFLNLGDTNFYLNTDAGKFNWNGGNWITSGYIDRYSGSTAVWNENVTILDGPNTGVLTNPASGDFSVPAGSPLINAGVALPASISSGHNVTLEYHDPRSYQARADTDDIGAFMYGGGGAGPSCSDGLQNGDETGVDCGGSCGACGAGEIIAPFMHPAMSN